MALGACAPPQGKAPRRLFPPPGVRQGIPV